MPQPSKSALSPWNYPSGVPVSNSSPWDELVAISDWCKEPKCRSTLTALAYGVRAILRARLRGDLGSANSVYVSFYKGLAGLGGCILAGPARSSRKPEYGRRVTGATCHGSVPLRHFRPKRV